MTTANSRHRPRSRNTDYLAISALEPIFELRPRAFTRAASVVLRQGGSSFRAVVESQKSSNPWRASSDTDCHGDNRGRRVIDLCHSTFRRLRKYPLFADDIATQNVDCSRRLYFSVFRRQQKLMKHPGFFMYLA